MRGFFLKFLAVSSAICLSRAPAFAVDDLMVFSGAAFKKPMDELIAAYKKKTGTDVAVSYGNVKTIMSQVSLTKQGDVFVVPSPDIMDKAVRKGIVLEDSVRSFCYVVPAIIVQKGNPKNIRGLKDLLRDDVRFVMANPETVYIGMLSAEILDRSLSQGEREILRKKVITYADDISKLATYIVMNQADAVLGFDFLKSWDPDKTDIVKLRKEEILRIGAGQVGIIAYTRDREKAKAFIDFLLSDAARDVFRKYGYHATEKEAFDFAGGKVAVGGVPSVGKEWLRK